MTDKPITVGQLIKELEKFDKDLPLIYASDDEGNGYQYVWFTPHICKFQDDGNGRGDSVPKEDEEYWKDDESNYEDTDGTEVICVN